MSKKSLLGDWEVQGIKPPVHLPGSNLSDAFFFRRKTISSNASISAWLETAVCKKKNTMDGLTAEFECISSFQCPVRPKGERSTDLHPHKVTL